MLSFHFHKSSIYKLSPCCGRWLMLLYPPCIGTKNEMRSWLAAALLHKSTVKRNNNSQQHGANVYYSSSNISSTLWFVFTISMHMFFAIFVVLLLAGYFCKQAGLVFFCSQGVNSQRLTRPGISTAANSVISSVFVLL